MKVLECQDQDIPFSPDRPVIRKREILELLQEHEEPEEVQMDHSIPETVMRRPMKIHI